MMKHRRIGVFALSLLCVSQVARGDALLIDVYDGVNPASYAEWAEAGIVEDVSGAAGGTFHANGNTYNIDGGLFGMYSGATGSYAADTFPGNGMLNDYLYVNQGAVTVRLGGLENTLTSTMGDMSGNTFSLKPNTDYRLYLFGAGDQDGQDTTFTFGGVTKTTSSVISGTGAGAGHFVTYEFTTGSDVSGFTLEFSYTNHSSDYGAWNGAAIIEIPDPNGFVIEAEDFSSQSGTTVEDCEDEGGGSDLGNISTGDWCLYENVRFAANMRLNFRVARNKNREDGHIEVRLDAVDGTLVARVDVPETGGWQEWQTVSTTLGDLEGTHDVYLVFVETNTEDGLALFNLNWWSGETGPVRVEAEAFVDGFGYEGEFQETEDVGGGLNLGWIDDGEWMEYAIEVESAGVHRLEFRVASRGGGGVMNLVSNGVPVGSVEIGDTGGWQEWTTIGTCVDFAEAGPQTLRLEFAGGGFNLNWFSHTLAEVPVSLVVGDSRNQMMRYGMDFERLWYWYGSALGDVPEWTVNDCNIDYIRTAMHCGYELAEGEYDLSAYTKKIIPMMSAMQGANPNIKWFASPRPLNDSEKDEKWQPYPLWITGADSGSSNFDFNAVKCAEYMIRYLLLMKSYGFRISYMDVTNEWQSNYASGGRVSPDDCVTIREVFDAYLEDPWPHPDLDPDLLLEADDFPLLIGPSSWNYSQGASWISRFTTSERREAIDIASSHNTNRTGTAREFAEAAKAAMGDDVEVWETEQHGWKGNSSSSEAMSFSYMIETIRAGFTGINGWLAIGTTNQGHCYLLNTGSKVKRNVKYYMFKKLSTTSNYGYALDIGQTDDLSSVTALVREDLLTIWVINTSTRSVLTKFDIGNRVWDGSEITCTRWDEDLSINADETPEGIEGRPVRAGPVFGVIVDVHGRAAYCIEIPLVSAEDNFPFVQAEKHDGAQGVSLEAWGEDGGERMVSFAGAGSEISFELDVTRTDTHDVGFRVSSESADISFDLYDGETWLGSVDRVATGGDGKWTTIYQTIELDGGPMDLRIVATGGGWNLDWIEFLRHTASTDAESGPDAVSRPKIVSVEADGASLTLTWSGKKGSTYALEHSGDLAGGFTTIEEGIPVHGETNSNTVATPDDSGFYRIREE